MLFLKGSPHIGLMVEVRRPAFHSLVESYKN